MAKRLILLVFVLLLTAGCGGSPTPATVGADAEATVGARAPAVGEPTAAATAPIAATAPLTATAPAGATVGTAGTAGIDADATGAATTAAGAAAGGGKSVILATTTSTQDSGLLDVLLPAFQKQTGYAVKPIAVGSGEALEMGERGDADVLLVHAPKSEEEFMATGAGVDRTLVMHNDFVIVGPASDPARVEGGEDAVAALGKIAAAKAAFFSRGDDSGTHKKELSLWEKTKTPKPAGAWYRETGTGMAETLRVASEKRGYTLTDRGTFLSQRDTLDLEVVVEGGKDLLNVYHVIGVSPEKFPKVNAAGAAAFRRFLVSPEAQELIGEFGREEFGQPLFVPDAGKAEDEIAARPRFPRAA